MRKVCHRHHFVLICLSAGVFFLMLQVHRKALFAVEESSELNLQIREASTSLPVPDPRSIQESIMLVKINSSLDRYFSLFEQLSTTIEEVKSSLFEFQSILRKDEASNDDQVKVTEKLSEDAQTQQISHREIMQSVIAVLVLVCNRPTVTKCLDKLLEYRPSSTQFPIIVSQDCGHHDQTTEAIAPYEPKIIHIYQPDQSQIDVQSGHKHISGYYYIARHYGWALDHVFNVFGYSTVIIVEDDLEVAPDFYEYFAATLPLLKKDESLWCVSAWNDNGRPERIDVNASEMLHRTDFFPGLGWMMTKNIWEELGPKWPIRFWDSWMREPDQRKDRACIRPEISRTYTFGKSGASNGMYFESHLKFIKLNDKLVNFTKLDLSYLLKQSDYNSAFRARVDLATPIHSISEIEQNLDENSEVVEAIKLLKRYGRFPQSLDLKPKKEFRITYRDNKELKGPVKEVPLEFC